MTRRKQQARHGNKTISRNAEAYAIAIQKNNRYDSRITRPMCSFSHDILPLLLGICNHYYEASSATIVGYLQPLLLGIIIGDFTRPNLSLTHHDLHQTYP